MHSWKTEPHSIAILRPVGVSCASFLEDEVQPKRNASERREAEIVDKRIDQIREIFIEAAELLGFVIDFHEYQLHGEVAGGHIASAKRSRSIEENHIFVTVEPTASQLTFVTDTLRHPLQRAVIACTNRNPEMLAPIVGTKRLPLVGQGPRHALQRVFLLRTPLHDEEMADYHRANIGVVSTALRYPHNKATASHLFERHRGVALSEEVTHDPEYRSLLVDQCTDETDENSKRIL